jgi:hypothetical protein
LPTFDRNSKTTLPMTSRNQLTNNLAKILYILPTKEIGRKSFN